MNTPLALLLASLAASSMAAASAASYSSEDMKTRQQIVQSTTESAVDTTGARATAAQEAQNVAWSRQLALPDSAERRADEKAAAVYPQSGPSTAALSANNTEISKQLQPQAFRLGTPEAERWMREAATP